MITFTVCSVTTQYPPLIFDVCMWLQCVIVATDDNLDSGVFSGFLDHCPGFFTSRRLVKKRLQVISMRWGVNWHFAGNFRKC